MNVELVNPSKWHPLRVASQDRLRNTFTAAAPAAPAPKRAPNRAELEAIGSEMHDVQTRVSTKFGSELRSLPTPFYRSAGYETLNEFITEKLEKGLRESQQAAPTAPKVQQVRDEWSAPKPLLIVQPGDSAVLHIEESARVLIECEEEVGLQLSNTSSVRTLRLRNRNSKTGETTHVAFIAPAREYPQAALVIANGKSAAVLELMPQ
jgi:hypothetical protein